MCVCVCVCVCVRICATDREAKLALQSSLEQTQGDLAALSAVLLAQNQMSAPDEPDVAMDDLELKMEACLTPVASPTSWDLLVPPSWPVRDEETSDFPALPTLPASCLIPQEAQEERFVKYLLCIYQ